MLIPALTVSNEPKSMLVEVIFTSPVTEAKAGAIKLEALVTFKSPVIPDKFGILTDARAASIFNCVPVISEALITSEVALAKVTVNVPESMSPFKTTTVADAVEMFALAGWTFAVRDKIEPLVA